MHPTRNASSKPKSSEPIRDIIARVSPDLAPMPHMECYFEALDAAQTGPARVCLSYPPQHSKSTVNFHAIARAMLAGQSVIFATYSAEFASYQMRRARKVAEQAGVRFRADSRAICEWYTEEGGVMTAVGLGGAVTGKPADLIIIDDPVKGYAEAQSRAMRESTDDWLRASILTRANPGTSVFVVHTRFHPDDIIGRLSAEGWRTINLPAISDAGEALWPQERPIEFLREQQTQLGEHMFAALYQGQPRPRGQELFGAPHYYDGMPPDGYRLGIGVDLAYTKRTSSDYSVAVVLAEYANRYYLLDVVRKQCTAPDFGAHLTALMSRYPGARARIYAHGTELGSIDFFRRASGVYIDAMPATADKFVRAQPLSAAWNRGEVMLPRAAPWLGEFVREVTEFTGVNDPHDDCVDAMAAAFDEVRVARGPGTHAPVQVLGQRRTVGLRKSF